MEQISTINPVASMTLEEFRRFVDGILDREEQPRQFYGYRGQAFDEALKKEVSKYLRTRIKERPQWDK